MALALSNFVAHNEIDGYDGLRISLGTSVSGIYTSHFCRFRQ